MLNVHGDVRVHWLPLPPGDTNSVFDALWQMPSDSRHTSSPHSLSAWQPRQDIVARSQNGAAASQSALPLQVGGASGAASTGAASGCTPAEQVGGVWAVSQYWPLGHRPVDEQGTPTAAAGP